MPKNENVAQTLSTDSGHLVGVGSNDSGMAWPKVILLGSPSSIIIGQPVNLSIKLSHPQHKWIVTSYFMAQQQISDTDQGDRGGDDVKEVPAGGGDGGGSDGGGGGDDENAEDKEVDIDRDEDGRLDGGMAIKNTSSHKLNGQVDISTTLYREKTLLALEVRNLTTCDHAGLSEEQCQGKHSLAPLNRNLEFIMPVVVNAVAPDSDQEGGVSAVCEPDSFCERVIKGLYEIICDSLDADNFDFKLSDHERQLEGLNMVQDYLDHSQEHGQDPVLAVLNIAATVKTIGTTENDETRAARAEQQKKHAECRNKYLSKKSSS